MQITDIPTKLVLPFANAAGAGFIRSIPTTPTGTAGQASLQLGFPPDNFNPVSAGGVPPFGQDFNGLLNQMSAWDRWAATGAFPPYDPTWQAAVGGYPEWAIVGSLVEFGLLWISTVDNNLSNPDTGGAGWFAWSRIVTANKDLYVNAATGNDNNNGLSPATALATLQGAIYRAFQYPPSQFTIVIHVADGTYAAWQTPAWPGPSIIMDGNSVTPTNVNINNTSGPAHCCAVIGQNTVTVQNLTVQNSGSSAAGGFVAINGGLLTTKNTVNGPITSGGAVFEGFGGGQVLINGSHAFSGNYSIAFFGHFGGIVQLANSGTVNFTTTTPVTMTTFASANALGSILLNAPNATFTGSTTTGQRYLANLNGVISVNGGGANVFPGTVAGNVTNGGQYA